MKVRYFTVPAKQALAQQLPPVGEGVILEHSSGSELLIMDDLGLIVVKHVSYVQVLTPKVLKALK